MLHRRAADGLVVISQPSHAWVSGQLANAWGNDDFGFEEPGLELRLAAEQHDIAWLDWEASPTLNPATGLPHAFNELPTLEHLDIWNSATVRALAYGYLPATLISMHGTYLYESFHDFAADPDEERDAARSFLRREQTFQQEALRRIEQTHGLKEVEVTRLRRLVSTWDALSLAVCMGLTQPRDITGVPTASGEVDLRLTPLDSCACNYGVSPWPFRSDALTIRCETRKLVGTFRDTDSMRKVLREATTLQLELTLVRG